MIIQIPKKEAIIFPYINYNKKLKPIANVEFQYAANKKISFDALIDSGADVSCSFVPIGEKLNVDFTDYDKVPDVAYGLKGEPIPGYIAPISLWLGSYPEPITINVSWLDLKFNSEKHYPFILGRQKIFDEFDIVFQEHKKRVIFRKV